MTDQPIVTLNDGVTMPQFGLGVFQTPPDTAAEVVRQAVADGYRLVDTASMYRNEEGVGDALEGRTDVFVTTKLGNGDHGFDNALRAFDASAKRLRREPVDLYLIHWPRPRVGLYVETWKALVRLKEEGRIRSIGVSNFNRDHLERIIAETGVTPTVNQIELHPRFQQQSLRAVHDQLGIKTESREPARARRLSCRSRHRRRGGEARQDGGAGGDPLASRQRPDRDPEVRAARAPEGEYRRVRLPARRRRFAAHPRARPGRRPHGPGPGDRGASERGGAASRRPLTRARSAAAPSIRAACGSRARSRARPARRARGGRAPRASSPGR